LRFGARARWGDGGASGALGLEEGDRPYRRALARRGRFQVRAPREFETGYECDCGASRLGAK
jgi:hypothetical protein